MLLSGTEAELHDQVLRFCKIACFYSNFRDTCLVLFKRNNWSCFQFILMIKLSNF